MNSVVQKILMILAQILISMITEALLRKNKAEDAANANEEVAVQGMITAALMAIESIPNIPFYIKPFIANQQMLRGLAKSVADMVEELIAKGLDLVNKK